MSLAADPWGEDFHRRRRRRPPRWTGPAALGLIVLLAITAFVLRGPRIGVRESEQKIINVVLPPPSPPPPPEPKPPEPKPPTIAPPQPTPATPPPSPSPPQAAPDTSALTARQGAGPSTYGLAQGDGGGVRIGGTGGDNGFAAYASLAINDIRRATQTDPALASGHYVATIAVQVDADGRIVAVRLLGGSGDPKRDAELQRRLAGLQLSKRPPDGLPVMRLELNAGSGA